MEGNSITSFENLCKIFEMRIKLDKEKGIKTSLDILDNYEKYSKKIDSIYNSEFQKGLKSLISPGVTLEKEEDRLRRLIKLLEERLDRRVELEDRFYNATGKYITGLQVIVSDSELEEKRERFSLVSRYLETSREIEDVTESINKLEDLLEEEEKKKEEYVSKNRTMEDELYSTFMNIIRDDEYYKNISEEDINSELDSIRSKVSETKETLDITKESIGNLITNGLQDDYGSYVEEAERNYYSYKNKEIILKLYKLVIEFEDDFKLICAKREKISELLEEKKNLRESLSIDTSEELLSFEKIILLQSSTLDNEREVLENIANYTTRIKFKEERLEELNEVNNSVEILSILKEYGLIETYDTEENDASEDENSDSISRSDEEIELPSIDESVSIEIYDPYKIIEVKDYPKTLNVGLAKLKGESVREKVNKKLNPKVEESTFDDITSSISEEQNVSDVLPEGVADSVKQEVITEESAQLPIEVVPEVTNFENEVSATREVHDTKIEVPVWELPSQNDLNVNTLDNQIVNPLPVWEMVKPIPITEVSNNLDKTEEINNIDIMAKPFDNGSSNDMFWVPVSDAKLETKQFPNMNMSINNNFGGNDNFNFPTING